MTDSKNINELIADEAAHADLFDLKQWVERFPYFEILRLIYLRELLRRDNELFRNELRVSGVYFSDRCFAYRFVQGADGSHQEAGYEASVIATDYFAAESRLQSRSLRELAHRLREARLERLAQQSEAETDEDIAEKVKRLITEKRYFEALKTLKKINLNNSEKNVYFAVQIKYLETILNSTS